MSHRSVITGNQRLLSYLCFGMIRAPVVGEIKNGPRSESKSCSTRPTSRPVPLVLPLVVGIATSSCQTAYQLMLARKAPDWR
jgi:hypothetical protein